MKIKLSVILPVITALFAGLTLGLFLGRNPAGGSVTVSIPERQAGTASPADTRPTPDLPENELSYLEQQYKCLDVLHEMGQFQEGFEDSTAILKERVSEKINAILKSDKAKFLLRCASCGKPLPINHQYGICDKCHRKNMSYYGSSNFMVAN